MENNLGNSLVPPSPRKFSARAALVDLHDNTRNLLSECFRQFGIDSVPVSSDKADLLGREKFEACVVRVGTKAAPVLESARHSRSNSRMVIYGLGGTVKEALNLSEYGINAIFTEPLERSAAMKLVRSTQMLVLHELRRYTRIPVITPVSVVAGSSNRHFEASSMEISAGGMSLKSAHEISTGLPLEVSFALLTLPRVWVRGTVTWARPAARLFGIRFDPTDQRRKRVREWVESCLG
jgi:hypothetical protein